MARRPAIQQWTRTRSGQECEDTLLAGGVPCTRYRSVKEAIEHPQMQTRAGMARVTDKVGDYWVPNAPFQMPGLNTAARPHVPELGEHRVEVLVRVLGYTREQAQAYAPLRRRAHERVPRAQAHPLIVRPR